MNLIRHLPRFQRAYRELEAHAVRESWSRGQIESHQLECVNELWAAASERVPYYRRLKSASGLPDRFESLEAFKSSVPLLHKDPIKADNRGFLSPDAGRGAWHGTGGSTGGTPTYVFRSHAAHHEMLRSRYRFHAMWGVDIFDRWAYLWGHGASFQPGLRGLIDRIRRPINDCLRNRLRLSAYRLGREALQNHLQRLVKFDPAAIYAYSTAGFLLAHEAEMMELRWRSLKFVNLTAEPAFPHIVAAVERAFGVPAIIEYGSCECGFIAGEWPDRTIRVREDSILLETLPRSDGRYDIVVTVLNNPSFPLIRYAIGDVTDAPLRHPETGFAILSNIGGRDNDLIIARSGEPLHSFWFEDVFESHDSIRRWQLHQHVDGSIDVRFELTAADARLDLRALERVMVEHIGYPVNATVVEALPTTPAGKHRWIVSDLAAASSGRRHEIARAG